MLLFPLGAQPQNVETRSRTVATAHAHLDRPCPLYSRSVGRRRERVERAKRKGIGARVRCTLRRRSPPPALAGGGATDKDSLSIPYLRGPGHMLIARFGSAFWLSPYVKMSAKVRVREPRTAARRGPHHHQRSSTTRFNAGARQRGPVAVLCMVDSSFLACPASAILLRARHACRLAKAAAAKRRRHHFLQSTTHPRLSVSFHPLSLFPL